MIKAREVLEEGAGAGLIPEEDGPAVPSEADGSPFVRIENQEVLEHISSTSENGASPLASVQIEEGLEPVQHTCLNGDAVEEQVPSEWRQQPANLFQESHIVCHSSSGLPRDIPFHLLEEITDGFSDERKIGSGAFEKVYMGVLNDGEKIAVKMLYDMLGFEEEQFLNEFNNLARLQHPNIVRLVGYCHEIQKKYVEYNGRLVFAERISRALCFEYMNYGSLDKYLSDGRHGLDWNTRYKLIKGICKGLKYLHEELKPPIYHFDLKPANILLDENMLPKIADFGLSRFFGEEQTQITKSSVGTRGYLPPEYIERNTISSKFNIFSLGVIIIKIMTGPTGYSRSAEMSPKEFVELAHEKWRFRLQATSMHFFESYSKQVKRCMEIALSSVEADRHKRPRIGEIVKQLNETETMIHKSLQLSDRLRNDQGSSMDQWGITNKADRHKRPSIGAIVKQSYETKTKLHKFLQIPDRWWNGHGSSTDKDSKSIGLRVEPSCYLRGMSRNGMSTTKVKRRVGKYELGRTIGEGTFAKVRFARDIETGEEVAIKILYKAKILKHNMVKQIKRESSTMKLIKHPNVVRIYEVMESKRKIYIVSEYTTGGDLFQTIACHGRMKEGEARRYFQQLINAVDYCHSRGVYHRDLKLENLLLDSYGNLKVSDFELSTLSQQIKDDGLLHTTCGTPNYVPPEVLEDQGYDGAMADLWSCGVILFVLLAAYLPFEDSDLMTLYKKISNAEFTFPPWTSFPATKLLTRILDPNPMTRITIPEILEDKWFKKGYKHLEFDEKYDTTLDDVDAVFNDSEEHHVTGKEEEPVALNAFELISMLAGLNLGNLFASEQVQDVLDNSVVTIQKFKRETRFTSKCPPKEIVRKIEEAAKPLGFVVQKKNYKLRLEKVKAGRKGNLNVTTEILQVAPSLHMVDVRKAKGDTLEFHKFYKNLSKTLKDVFWKSDNL